MDNPVYIEFNNISFQDIIFLREFIDKHWKDEVYNTQNLESLKPLTDVYVKLKDIERVFDFQAP